jgi:hypothetical protein
MASKFEFSLKSFFIRFLEEFSLASSTFVLSNCLTHGCLVLLAFFFLNCWRHVDFFDVPLFPTFQLDTYVHVKLTSGYFIIVMHNMFRAKFNWWHIKSGKRSWKIK